MTGRMGNKLSTDERAVLRLMGSLMKKHNVLLYSHKLHVLLHWVATAVPNVDAMTIFNDDMWDTEGIKLYIRATMCDEQASQLLTPGALFLRC